MTPESQAAPPITEPAHGSGSFATGRRRPPNPARPSRSYSAETISKARRKFGRSIPPRDEWPGEEVTEDAVLEASGDPRDWFTYKMRLEAFAYIQEKHWSAWRKIERMGRQLKPIPFGQTLVCGHQGVGKSVLVCCECMRPYMKGYPFFHVGQSWLFGRNLVGPERYEVLRRLPLSSTIAYDEAHNPFDTGLSNSTGVRGWRAQSAGFRKKDARLWLASAKANLVAPTVRNTSTQLWRPLKVNIKNNFLDERPKQHSNPKNFVYVWEEWHNYPLERGDVFDSGQSQGNGRGPARARTGAGGRRQTVSRRVCSAGHAAHRLVHAGRGRQRPDLRPGRRNAGPACVRGGPAGRRRFRRRS